LNAEQEPPAPLAGPVACDLAGWALARLPLEAVPEARRRPEEALGRALPPSFLKHADEQTVTGLAAVFAAVRDGGLGDVGFRDWAVLAAPHFLGRSCMAGSLERYRAEGAWGVSPHIIPHRSLHSLSGSVSQALQIHGPNFGVGGGGGGTSEALLAAAALLARGGGPGAWVVVTAVEPDLPLTPEGGYAPGSACVGLALALVPARRAGGAVRLRVTARPGARGARYLAPARGAGATVDLARLHAAVERLGRERGAVGTLRELLEGGARLELEWAAPAGAAGGSNGRAAVPAPTRAEARR
jgi:hypothetical protein